MFDFSFGELSLIAVVALLVLGPERLPRVARTAGALARRARNSWQSVREEIERELQAEEIKRALEQAQRAAQEARADLHEASAEVRASVENTAAQIQTASAPAASQAIPPPQDAPRHE